MKKTLSGINHGASMTAARRSFLPAPSFAPSITAPMFETSAVSKPETEKPESFSEIPAFSRACGPFFLGLHESPHHLHSRLGSLNVQLDK